MNPEIPKLLKLQEEDVKIFRLQKELDLIPKREEELRTERARLEAQVIAAEAAVREIEKKIREQEAELEGSRLNMNRLKYKQSQVKTNQEYTALLLEIDYIQKDTSKREDVLLDLMEQVETHRKNMETASKRNEGEVVRLDDESKRLRDSAAFLEAEIQAAVNRRDGMCLEVTPPVMQLYRKLASMLGGLAVAEARDQICSVCHVMMRPQFYQELRLTEGIMQCENCHRVLYIES